MSWLINVPFNGNTARLVYGWIHGNDVDLNKCLHIKYENWAMITKGSQAV